MVRNPSTKVVLIQSVLRGSTPPLLQEVAAVHIDEKEFRVYAPPTATGKAIDWAPHFSVRRQGSYFDGEERADEYKAWALRLAKEAIENEVRDRSRADGTHPDGIHCSAQVCRKGHIQHCDGMPFDSDTYCTKCGASCIHECPACAEPIRGSQQYQDTRSYLLPLFCHRCGRPYPWMEDRLQTARRLLDHAAQLSDEEREEVWGDLQYVMSDPKADLVLAKRKLIQINLAKASEFVRDGIVDIIARTMAEVIKG